MKIFDIISLAFQISVIIGAVGVVIQVTKTLVIFFKNFFTHFNEIEKRVSELEEKQFKQQLKINKLKKQLKTK